VLNASALTKVGNGTLTLTGNNDLTGGTLVNGGTLVLPGNGGWGRIRGALTVNAGATVSTTGDGTGFGYNNQLTSLTINGGLVSIGTSSSHIWNIAGGVSMTGGEMSGTTFQWNRTALTTNASANSAVISGSINLRNDSGYSSWNVAVADGAADTDLLVSAAITGGGVALTKSGNGKMKLTGGISFNGAINVDGGLLELPEGDWLTGDPWGNTSVKGLITIGAGATLSLSGGTTQFRNGLTLNGGTLSSRGLAYGGTWRNIVLSSDVTAAGGGVSTIASSINVDGSRTWNVGAGGTLNVTGELGGWVGSGGSLTKTGNGTLRLSGVNSYGGATTINGGTLVLDAGGNTFAYADGDLSINGGSTLRVSGLA
jgi:autotransporter-associated beta strand protein